MHFSTQNTAEPLLARHFLHFFHHFSLCRLSCLPLRWCMPLHILLQPYLCPLIRVSRSTSSSASPLSYSPIKRSHEPQGHKHGHNDQDPFNNYLVNARTIELTRTSRRLRLYRRARRRNRRRPTKKARVIKFIPAKNPMGSPRPRRNTFFTTITTTQMENYENDNEKDTKKEETPNATTTTTTTPTTPEFNKREETEATPTTEFQTALSSISRFLHSRQLVLEANSLRSMLSLLSYLHLLQPLGSTSHPPFLHPPPSSALSPIDLPPVCGGNRKCSKCRP